MKFSSYSLKENLVKALNNLGYEELTSVQEKTIVQSLRGKSLIAKSQTGSGKTHAYLIPVINNLNESLNKVQAVIVEPTIELCIQCSSFANDIANIIKTFRVLTLTNVNGEAHALENLDRPTILITTPGKLHELLFVSKSLETSPINSIVLDECDMLLEGEQSQEMINIVDKIDAKQKLIFTATMKEHQITSLKKLFHISEMIEVDKNYSSRNVSHHFVDVKHRPLDEALEIFLMTENPYFTLVFASKKKTISSIYQSFCKKGIKCALLSSDLDQRERKNLLKRIKDGEFSLVLCSDLASRGLDLDKVSHVISLDIPQNVDYYHHRAGRTGRYKDKGDSYIFYDDDLNKKAKLQLENKIKFDYLILRQEGLKLDKKHTPKPPKKNAELEAAIKKELGKIKNKGVKPGYKKKRKRAIEKAKQDHKRKIIMQNLRSKRKAMNSID